MTRLKRKLLRFILVAALCVGCVVLVPAAFIFMGDIIGSFVNQPFSICEVMDRNRLETALGEGFEVNAGCCVEHMVGECSIARPNSSALIFAVENKSLEAVKLLLEHGADVNKSTESGFALSNAASQGSIEIAEALLARGITSASREPALRMAAHVGHSEIAQIILEHEAPESKGASCGRLACSLATDLLQSDNAQIPKQMELFEYLISNCLDPNIFCEGAGRLLGYLAKKDEHAPLIRSLLEHGADLNAKEANGKTVRDNLKAFWDYNSRPQIKALIESKPSN